MGRLEEIEAAIVSLPPGEYSRFVDWFLMREQTLWDEQIDRDSAAGKLDFLFDETQSESAEGSIRAWPED